MATRRITILTRPFSSEGFHFFAEHALAGHEVRFTSDWRGTEQHWLMRSFYEAFGSNATTAEMLPPITLDDADDIVARCRFLRSLQPEKARRIVAAMGTAALDLIERNDPDLIISCHIDCYVYDVIARLQRDRGKAYLALSEGIVEHYGGINYRFLPMDVREPDEEEVKALVSLIRDREFRPAYMFGRYYDVNYLSRFVRLYLRQKARRVWFPIRRWAARDPLNFHWNTATGEAVTCQRLRWLATVRYFDRDWEQRLAASPRPAVFIPLQWYPEARYDYADLDSRLRNLPRLTLDLCERLSPDCDVALKEHPAIFGSRDPKFYEALLRVPNVVIVPHLVPTAYVSEKCDCLITPAATICMEAAIRGQRVITVGRPAYYVDDAFEVIDDPEQLENLPRQVCAPPAVERNGLAEVVARKVLSQLLPGAFQYNRFDRTDPVAAEEMKTYSRNFARHLDVISEAALRVG